jgi:hypothetical protein
LVSGTGVLTLTAQFGAANIAEDRHFAQDCPHEQ